MIIVGLYSQETSLIVKSYVDHLYMISGVLIGESIVTLILEQAFPYSDKLHAVNLIPLDKFRPINIELAEEFMQTLSKFPKKKLKFFDEKLIKKSDDLNRKRRGRPFSHIIDILILAFIPVFIVTFNNSYPSRSIVDYGRYPPCGLYRKCHMYPHPYLSP